MTNIDLSNYTAEQRAALLKQATETLAKRTSGQGVLGDATQELATRVNTGSLNVAEDDELTRQINANQEQDFKFKSTSDEPEVRSKIEEQVKTAKPAVPDTTKLYEDYTTGTLGEQYKTTGLEAELAELDKQIAAEKSVAEERFDSIESKTVPMGVIAGRLGEAEKQENRRLSALTLRATAIQNQLKTRYSLISNMISYASKDYETAKAEYDQEYKTAADAIESANKKATQEQKDALSTWQTISNLITSGSISYDNLTASQKLEINKTETAAGLPSGTLELMTKSTDGGKVLSTSTVELEDGRYAYVVTQGKDGSISTQKMYLGKTAKTKDDDNLNVSQAISYVSEAIKTDNLLGEKDNKMSPDDWNRLLQSWQSQGLPKERFIEEFSQYVNTAHRKDYLGVNY